MADCICLYGLHHIGAFPVDTHVKETDSGFFYPDRFPFRRYEGFAGIIQQYMFYYKLSLPASAAGKKSGKQRNAKKRPDKSGLEIQSPSFRAIPDIITVQERGLNRYRYQSYARRGGQIGA